MRLAGALVLVGACGPSLHLDAGMPGPACNSLGDAPATLPTVAGQFDKGDAPVPHGGPVADGHYVLRGFMQFHAGTSGTASNALAGEIEIASGEMQAAFVEMTGVFQYSATLAPAGTAWNAAVTCRSGTDAFGVTADAVTGYDATPTTLTLQLYGGAVVMTFARE